jgi:uncharacterized glyoxalase superfamily protein PhnB
MEKAGKKKSVRAIPEGFHTVTPFLMTDNAAKLIEFIQNAFDAELTFITKTEDNKIMHATVTIGDSIIMISDNMENTTPQTAMLYLYLENVDAIYKKAIQAKAISIHEPTDEFYGDRAAAVKDEWGNVWWIATHVEDVSDEELKQRSKQILQEQKGKKSEVHA